MRDCARPRSSDDGVLILVAVCLTSSVLPLDFSGAAAATPAIGRELGGTPVELGWIVNAFMLSFGSCVMAAGTLADALGRRRVFAIGVALFALTSVAVAFAPSVGWLDAARVAQGVSAAATLSGGSAALAQEFDGPARARAFSLLGTTFGVGLAFGPALGGFLISTLGWRSVFLIGTIIGALALAIGLPRMRESRDPEARGVDWPATTVFTGALALFTFALIEAPESGWSSPLVLGLFAAAAALFAAFAAVEARAARPMLDLSLFRYPRFVGVQILPIATACCYVVLLILLPIRFIGVERRSAIEAGLMMIALSAPMLVVPFLAATLSRRVSAGAISGVGLVVSAAGLVWLSRVASSAPASTITKPMLLIGLGVSMPWGLMDGLSVSVVPRERAGMAAGIFGTTRVAGEGVALAATRAILATLVQSSLARSSSLDPRSLAEAAQRVVSGDLGHTSANVTTLVRAYEDGFRTLCTILAVFTAASAVAVIAFLGRAPSHPESS